jgi:outer membrane protein OmpA-like peptidoglycan-associated protein
MRIAQKLADVLQQNPQRMALAEGFTDSVGTNAYNQALSERRSDAVRSALHGMGVSRDRISSRGYGESFPVAGNHTADERRLNRRVEIILSDDSGKIAPR